MSDSNPIGTALWLVAGGAAGLAAGRWIVPHLAAPLKSTPSSPVSVAVAAMTRSRPNGRSVGGPSGDMQPIDPYTPVITVPAITSAMPTPNSVAPTTQATATQPTGRGPTAAPSTSVPITMPSQLEIAASPVSAEVAIASTAGGAPTTKLATGAAFATSQRVRRFDHVFARYRGALPIEYVRALVERESNGLPNARAGSAIGLMQVVPVVLADYNKRHGTGYRAEHLTDPAINVAIGCELLRLIVDSYRKNHPRTLRTNWENPRFVELLTFGYNAGFSETGGVGRVARYLEGLGAADITIDQVSAHAKLAGASKHLSNPAKVAWCKSVVALYQRERALALPLISA